MSENRHRFSILSKQTSTSDDFIVLHTLPSLLSQEGQHLMCTITKFKFHPRTSHESLEGEKRYSSTLSITSALDGSGWSTPRPSLFTPGKKTQCLLYRRLGGPQGQSGQVRKMSPLPGFDSRTVQPVASRYTDFAIPAHNVYHNTI